jgi:hypothetical protein
VNSLQGIHAATKRPTTKPLAATSGSAA